MKVLVTGSTGFIGKHSIAMLLERGYEVHTVTRQSSSVESFVHSHQLNLFDKDAALKLINEIKPTHLLHFAWEATPGVYWTSLDNLDWVEATLSLVKNFTASGGKRLVVAGTCAEYDWSHGVCVENKTPLIPATLYGTYKNATQLMLEAWSKQTKLSSAWGRIFSVYGPHEHPGRLISGVIKNLLLDQKAICLSGNLIRDYLHASDIALGFVSLLESDQQGPVNISSGGGISLGQLVKQIGKKLDKENLLEISETVPTLSNPASLIGDNSILVKLGWKPEFSLEVGLDDTISWWKKELKGENGFKKT